MPNEHYPPWAWVVKVRLRFSLDARGKSLILHHVPPYELGLPGPPAPARLYPPTAKFWQEFPNGQLPVKFTDHLQRSGGDLVDDLLETLAVFEGARAIVRDPKRAVWLGDEYRSLRADEERQKFEIRDRRTVERESHRQRRIEIVRSLLRSDVPLPLVCQLCEEPPQVVVAYAIAKTGDTRRQRDPHDVARLVLFDAAVRGGDEPAGLARRMRLNTQLAKAWFDLTHDNRWSLAMEMCKSFPADSAPEQVAASIHKRTGVRVSNGSVRRVLWLRRQAA